MAKYGKTASKEVASAMRRRKKGTLVSGSGRKVRSRKQAIAIGLSEARDKGASVPEEPATRGSSRKRTARRATGRKSTRRKSTARKSTAPKTASGKTASRKTTTRDGAKRRATARARKTTRRTGSRAAKARS